MEFNVFLNSTNKEHAICSAMLQTENARAGFKDDRFNFVECVEVEPMDE